MDLTNNAAEGILLVDKPSGITSFTLVSMLRRRLKVKKIGHTGTLDPFATGLMVMLIGRKYTRMSDALMDGNKTYRATARLGITTDSYDCDGTEVAHSTIMPSYEEIAHAIANKFNGRIDQLPPMFSAKKIGGKKLYELARKGVEIERAPHTVDVTTTIISYDYPFLTFDVFCTKGTYIRSIAHDLGTMLGCGAHLTQLQRLSSGSFHIEKAIDAELINDTSYDITHHLMHCDEDIS